MLAATSHSSPTITVPWVGPDEELHCPLLPEEPGVEGGEAEGSGPLSWGQLPRSEKTLGVSSSTRALGCRGGGRARTADFLTPTRGLGTGLEDFVSITEAAEAAMVLDFWAWRAS